MGSNPPRGNPPQCSLLQAMLAAMLLLSLVAPAAAQPPQPAEERPAEVQRPEGAASDPQPLLYRREFIPKSLLERDAKGLIPVKRSEFESLLKAAQAKGDPDRPNAWVELVELSAQRVDDTLQGTGRIHVPIVGGMASDEASAAPRTIELPGFRLPVRKAVWEGPMPVAATIGVSDDGKLYLLADRSGVVSFEWSLPLRSTPWGDAWCDLPLPTASRCTLNLKLDAPGSISVTAGTVRSSDPESLSADWQVDLTGVSETRLRMTSPANRGSDPITLVRESTQCLVAAEEVEVQTLLRLDVHRQSRRQLELALAGDWVPSEIRQGDNRIPFEIMHSGEAGRVALLRFDPPLEGTNRRLTVVARQPILAGSRFSLPVVRVRDSTWLEGAVSVEQTGDWELSRWEIDRAAAVSSIRTEGTRAESRWNLQSSDGRVSFVAEPVAARLQSASGATIRLDDDTATARIVTDFRANGPGLYEIVGEIDPSWIIDSVEAIPAAALDDWEVTSDGSSQLLRLALRTAVGNENSLRVAVLGHRPPVAQEEIAGEQLRPLLWRAGRTKGHVALIVDSRWQLELAGTEARRLDPASLPISEAERLQLSEEVNLVLDDQTLEGTSIRLREAPPKFAAHWQIRVGAEADRANLLATVRVEPEVSLLERFRVLVRPGVGKDCVWRMQGDDPEGIIARLVRAADAASGEEEWEITLRAGRRTPFTVTASLASFGDGRRAELPIFRSLEARRQTAEIALTASRSSYLVAERALGLDPVWPGDSSGDVAGSGDVVAAWSYDPNQAASLSLRWATAAELHQLLNVRGVALETRLAPQGSLHVARYLVECSQPQLLSVVLPPLAKFESATVDGRGIDVAPDGAAVSLPVPKTSQPIEVELRYRTPRRIFLAGLELRAAWPECGYAVSSRTWQVHIPDAYRVLGLEDHSSAAEPGRSPLHRWWQRFHAPLPGWETQSNAVISEVGRMEVRFDSDAGIPAKLRLVRRDLLATVGWSLLAIAWLLVGAVGSSTRRVTILIALLGAIAFALPPVVDPLGRMMLLGIVLGMATRWWNVRRAAVRPAAWDSNSAERLATAAPLIAFFAFAAAGWCGALAQDDATDKKVVIHRVVFPVDEQGRETDDYVLMSERFFLELFASSQRPTPVGPAWLLRQASYQVIPAANARTFERLDGELQVEVLAAPATVRIPWSQTTARLLPDQVRLNERAIPVTWDPAGEAFSVAIATAGTHRIGFVARPVADGDDDLLDRWSLSLPPTPQATMRVDLLRGAADVRVTSGTVESRRLPGDAALDLQIPGGARIALATRPRTSAPVEVAAEQLLWISLWPGAAIVEGRWRFRAPEGVLESAAVDFGGDLELVSTAASLPATSRWITSEGQSVLRWFPREPASEIIVEAMLLWRGDSHDSLVLPRVEPQAGAIAKRWLAIDSLDSTARLAPPEVDRGPLDVQMFASVWNAELAPSQAFRIDQPGPVPLLPLSTAAATKHSTTTRLEFRRDAATWEFTALLESVASSSGGLRLQIPSSAEVSAAEVGIAGQFRAATAIALSNAEVLVIPESPLKPGDTLRLLGTLHPADGEPLEIELPQLVESQATEHLLEVWRDSAVQVTLDDLDPRFKPVQPSRTSSELIPVARAIVSLAADPSPPKVRISRRPNRPRTVGILVTTLRQEGAQWIARLDGYLAVRNGALDSFVFESSVGWEPASLMVGQGQLESEPPQGGVRRFRIRPDQAVGDRLHFACEAPISGSSTARVQAPAIRLLHAEATQDYVVLPARAGWSTLGLQQSSLPMSVPLPAEGTTVYRVLVPQFEANLDSPATSSPAPVIVSAAFGASRFDQSLLCQATLAVLPDRSATLPLRLPPGSRFIRAEVEGEGVIAYLDHQRQVQIPLRSSRLSQEVSVTYAIDAPPADDDQLLPLPAEPWKLERSWDLGSDGLILDLEDFERLLSEVLRDSLGSPAAEQALPASWAARWLGRLQTTRQALEEVEFVAEEEAQRWYDLEEALLELTEAPSFPGAIPSATIDNPAANSWSESGPAWWIFSTFAAFAWLASALGGERLARVEVVREFLRRWPHLLAVLLGLAVAALVSPVWIGGAVMAVAALGSLAWPWRTGSGLVR
jgi:hypothetical protein